MSELFVLMHEKGASDLHLTAGASPTLRIDGELVPTPFPKLSPDVTQSLVFSLMTDAQRLTRSICKHCRETYEVDSGWLAKFGIPESVFASRGKIPLARGRGCENCAKTGYRGRAGLYEVLEVTDSTRQLILDKAPARKIKETARKQGMITMRECAVRKVLAGATTIEELVRVTASDAD